jgi:hypothetical protein
MEKIFIVVDEKRRGGVAVSDYIRGVLLYSLASFRQRWSSYAPGMNPAKTMVSLACWISRHLHLRMQTQAFNAYHDTLSLRLASRKYLRTRKCLLSLYDAGSILGVFGMLTAVAVLVWTTGSLSSSTLLRLTTPQTPTRLLKRAAEASSRLQTYSSVTHAVNPIVS